MKRQLQLSELAGYLPYGLKLKYDRPEGVTDVIRTLFDIEDDDTIKIKIGHMDGEHIWMFKPILRPIADLDHYAVPYSHYALNVLLETAGYSRVTVDQYQGKIDIEIEPSESYSTVQYLNFEVCQIINKFMYEHHFDIHGLIADGLAIDINTI